MVFADLFFIYVFLPLCLICYGLAKKLSTKNIVLIVFSLIFYAWGEPLWILLLLFSSFFNWFIGILIGKFRDTPRAKLAVGGGIFVDILLLLIFKYSAFIVENLNAVSGAAIPVPQITLPIGISFYTFQAISYILDCYWETVDVQPKYHKFLLYLSLPAAHRRPDRAVQRCRAGDRQPLRQRDRPMRRCAARDPRPCEKGHHREQFVVHCQHVLRQGHHGTFRARHMVHHHRVFAVCLL